jgi:hypothetical protein
VRESARESERERERERERETEGDRERERGGKKQREARVWGGLRECDCGLAHAFLIVSLKTDYLACRAGRRT